MKATLTMTGLLLAILLVAVGCGQAEQSADDAKKSPEKIVNQSDEGDKNNDESDKEDDKDDEDDDDDKESDKDDEKD